MKTTSKTNRLDLPELVVDLYNGAKSANVVTGSKKPRSAPIVATNFDLKSDSRYEIKLHFTMYIMVHTCIHTITCRCTSRTNMIPFFKPSVGPVTPEAQRAYSELTAALQQNKFSSCVGWVINLVTELESDMVKNDNSVLSEIKETLNEVFPGAPRLRQGWSVVLFYTKKVSITNYKFRV